MAIINGTNLNDNDTFQFNPFPFLQFFAKLDGTDLDDTISGFGGNDILNGFNGNDVLNGGADADTMNGGDGNDTYFVDNVGDVILNTTTFNPNLGEVNDFLGGVDTVNSFISYTLGASLENLNLTGFAAINGTGNIKNNVINGNSASNVLDGGAGADTMNAGDGSDTYFVDNTGDVVSESWNDALGGVDTVNS
ncbi:calcium-binding protein, partial [Methyloglobulus sp.]|uniref:calcium-binding protein n=1 Tax=Methyloglobulus sp. TaxID=2518622 RepID=UPI0032B79C50